MPSKSDGLKVCARCATAKPLSEFYVPPKSYCRQCTRTYSLDWRKRYPQRRHAHTRVAAALKYGELVRANACERCGEKTYTVAHHEDYTSPLKVTWLCDTCHAIRHVELRKAARENGKKGGRPKKTDKK